MSYDGDVDNVEGDNSVAGCSPTTSPGPRSYGYTPAPPERAAAGYIDLVEPLVNETPPSVLMAREEAWRMKSPQETSLSAASIESTAPLSRQQLHIMLSSTMSHY